MAWTQHNIRRPPGWHTNRGYPGESGETSRPRQTVGQAVAAGDGVVTMDAEREGRGCTSRWRRLDANGGLQGMRGGRRACEAPGQTSRAYPCLPTAACRETHGSSDASCTTGPDAHQHGAKACCATSQSWTSRRRWRSGGSILQLRRRASAEASNHWQASPAGHVA